MTNKCHDVRGTAPTDVKRGLQLFWDEEIATKKQTIKSFGLLAISTIYESYVRSASARDNAGNRMIRVKTNAACMHSPRDVRLPPPPLHCMYVYNSDATFITPPSTKQRPSDTVNNRPFFH